MNSTNTVAVLLATYNGANYLKEQLDSIERQTYSDWNLIVSDDGSTDATIDILEVFCRRHEGKVIIIDTHGENRGACGNFFFLMRCVAGYYPYYAFCDQDDYWLADKLDRLVSVIRSIEEPEVPALVFSDAFVSDNELKCISQSFFKYTGVDPTRTKMSQLLAQNPISGAGVLVNNELIKLAIQPKNLMGIDMHDQWMGLVASAFGSVACVREATYLYRQHDGNEIGAVRMSVSSLGLKARVAQSSLNRKKRQAAAFMRTYGEVLDERQIELVDGFSSISALSKVSRVVFCVKNGVLMNGIMRNAGLLLFI